MAPAILNYSLFIRKFFFAWKKNHSLLRFVIIFFKNIFLVSSVPCVKNVDPVTVMHFCTKLKFKIITLSIKRRFTKDAIRLLIHRFQKKPEVTPKRGLIALAVDTQSDKHGERSGKASLSSNIPEELTD